MTSDQANQMILDRLARIEEKQDQHIAESAPIQAQIAVLQAEMRLIKFVAGGLALALMAILAETLWALLTAA